MYFSIPRGGAVKALQNAPRPIDFAAFHNISRHPEACFDSSVSGMSVWIDKDHPELFTHAWVSMPARALSLPLVMGASHTPVAMLNGEADALARKAVRKKDTWEPMERQAFDQQHRVFTEARGKLAEGKVGDVAAMLDGWTEDTVKAFLSSLSQE